MAAEWEKRIMGDGKKMKEIHQEFLTGERALFQGKDLKIYDTIFDDGESPLKESRNIELYGSIQMEISAVVCERYQGGGLYLV